MKRMLAWILLAFMALTMGSFAYDDVTQDMPCADAVERLTAMGIVSGKGEGMYDPSGYVTRAEFSKMAVLTDSLKVNASYGTLFSDVASSFWGSGYIASAAKSGILLGYPDGSFHPDEPITHLQAVTVALRLLGYTTESFYGRWPEDYVEKAQELSLIESTEEADEKPITRGEAALLLDKALQTEMYEASGKGSKLMEKLDYTLTEECIILGLGEEEAFLRSDEVATTLGTYQNLYPSMAALRADTVKLILDKEQKIIGVVRGNKTVRHEVIETIAGNRLILKGGETVHLDNAFPIYYQGNRETYRSLSDILEAGDSMDLCFSGDNMEYALLRPRELSEPFLYESDRQGFPEVSERTKLIRDGNYAALDALKERDVLYYDARLDTLYAYSDTVSGIYEEAFPNKADIETIKLSGMTYTLETYQAKQALSLDIPIGSYVTLLLGKDGDVAFVVAKKETDVLYGVLLSSERKLYDGSKKPYASFITSEGKIIECVTDKEYSKYIGRVYKLVFEDGVLYPKLQKENADFSGEIIGKTIGGYSLSDTAKIVDMAYVPRVTEKLNAVGMVVEPYEITKSKLDKSDILFIDVKNESIDFLVLNNVTLKGWSFGIVTEAVKLSSSSTYTLDIGGYETTYSMSVLASPNRGDVVKASIQEGQLLCILPLLHETTRGSVKSLEKDEIVVGTTAYPMAKDAVIYVKSGTYQYDVIDIDDVDTSKIKNVELYSDKSMENGGQIHIVRLTLAK